MRIIRRQRRRSSLPRYSRRRQRCRENGINATGGATVVSGGAGDRLGSVKMSDPMYNMLIGLVVVAAVVAVAYFTTLTIIPRAVLVMGMAACIWNVMGNFWGTDELEDE